MSQKWIGLAIVTLILIAGAPWYLHHGPVGESLEQASLAPNVERQPSSADNYCVAVRGNGDLMPAHWGALARVFETYGAPEGMAGASSASMTTFLWESAMANPQLAKDKFERGRELALMFKSLEGLTYTLYEKRGWRSLVEWVQRMQKEKTYNPLTILAGQAAMAKHIPNAVSTLNDLKNSGIFFGPAVAAVAELVFDPAITTDRAKQAQLRPRVEALKQALAVLGKFDAKNDAQLFVRNGVIDFGALALRFSAVGDFFALRDASAAAVKARTVFLETCLPVSPGRTWTEIVKAEPRCQSTFADFVSAFFDEYTPSPRSRVHDKIGRYAQSLVTTSVVSGSSAQEFRQQRAAYLKTLAPGAGAEVRVLPKDLRFGYWGRASDLEQIAAELQNPNNPLSVLDKSHRFMPLGEGTWLQALSLSPAEPGLSPALEFSSVGMNADWVSFGGWSDLHPVPVLKAAGCSKVVYVTRRTGDSLFSQGVVKRLLNFDRPGWDLLDSTSKEANLMNNNGTDEFADSVWHKLYNLKNPQSSFAGSLAAADAVLCTDWNAYDVKTQFPQLIATSYEAPIFERTPPPHGPDANPTLITSSDNAIDPTRGDRPYAGCIP